MAGPTLKPSTFAPKKLARIIHERAAAGLAAPSKAVPAHPPLSAPKHGGGHCCSSGKYSHLPAPKKERQAAGLAGGRELPLGRYKSGHGALALRRGGGAGILSRAPHVQPGCKGTGGYNSFGGSIGYRVALLLLHLLLPKHLGRGCRARETAPPAPKRSARPQGGRVGETCPSSAAPAAEALWQGQAITLALRTSGAPCHLRNELRFPKALVGRTRCPIVGACIAANARWPSLLHSRNCPTHPPLAVAAKAPWLVVYRSSKSPTHPPSN